MTEYDIPWKEVLDAYLKDFLELCLPEVHDGIDWSSPIENREQELPKLFPKSQSAGRVADKLFRARFKDDQRPTWFMIHTEVQVTRQAKFARRMFTCFYRILDRFHEGVVCIGILGDSSPAWRPDTWQSDLLGCQIRFAYPIVKLQDFAGKIESLKQSPNPFATVIASHLQAQGSQGSPADRFRFKVELVRSLYEKQWSAEKIRQLFRFIDWVMDLPGPLELKFKDVLAAIEQEKSMPYITSIERIARTEGEAKGEARGEARGEAIGEVKGKVRMLQELLGLPVISDAEFADKTPQQLEQFLAELRKRFDSR